MPSPMTLIRTATPLVALVCCTWLLSDRISAVEIAGIPEVLRQIPPRAVLLSLAFTALSMWAIGRYDVVAHRHLDTGQSTRNARRAGVVAIALCQTLGFGLFTGALARWRMLPGLSGFDALRLSGFVATSFIASLCIIGAGSVVVLQGPDMLFLPALALLGAVPLLALGLLVFPVIRIGGVQFTLPSLKAVCAILCWTLADTVAACLALYVLLPGTDLSFAAFFPVFLLALGAGLITGTPGGVGPFELTLLTLLPGVPQGPLLAALVCYRITYYAVPAILAMTAMMRPCAPQRTPAPNPIDALHRAPRSEVGIIRQNAGRVLHGKRGAVACMTGTQALVALCDPIRGGMRDLLPDLCADARRRNLIPLLYKTNARCAVEARSAGWQALHIADEAVICPITFTLGSARHRQLRRKLRAAQKSGISITSPPKLPWQDLARIDASWQDIHGAARGGTMGRFCPSYLSDQKVLIAWRDARPVAFVSFHISDREWCLDLMRQGADAPDGTMHALVHHALDAARQGGIARLSLAATPACPNPHSAVMRWLAQHIVKRAGGPGLRQFKSAFAPYWQPLYAASPTRTGLTLGLLDVARAVHRPDPLIPSPVHKPHNEDENYELVSITAP